MRNDRERAAAVWETIGECFGKDALARKFGPVPPGEWERAIGELSEFDVERGLRRIRHSGKPHVPTLPEFRRICREISNDETDQRTETKQTDDRVFPRWVTAANTHMLAHLLRRWEQERRTFNPAETAILVAHKNHWAEEMRDAESDGSQPADHGRMWFLDRMRLAEQQMGAA